MPDASYWNTGQAAGVPGAAAPSAANREEAEMQADLARLFAVRDANMTEANWEATSLSALPDIDSASGRSAGAWPVKPGGRP